MEELRVRLRPLSCLLQFNHAPCSERASNGPSLRQVSSSILSEEVEENIDADSDQKQLLGDQKTSKSTGVVARGILETIESIRKDARLLQRLHQKIEAESQTFDRQKVRSEACSMGLDAVKTMIQTFVP